MTFERQDPRKTVSFRASDELVSRIEDLPMSKSEFLRQAAAEKLERTPENGIEPPEDQELAKCYAELVEMANDNGHLPEDLAVNQLAQSLGRPAKQIRRTVLRPLSRRGYVQRQSDLYGYTSLKVQK